MDFLHTNLIALLWLAWFAYWGIAARSVKADVRQESAASRIAHIFPLIAGALLLWLPRLPGGFLGGRFLPATSAVYWTGAALVAIGLGFSVWARVLLGRNWSGIVTLKQDHELVRRGPYRCVRHPIYTGLLLAFVGSAVAIGEWRGIVAVLTVFVALWRKLRLEERWMVETFGDEYRRYCEQVRALIPFVL